jgi:hypothetical protein
MKKNLLALAALGASVALLAGCGTKTPAVQQQTGTDVEQNVTPPAPTVAPSEQPEVAPTADTGTNPAAMPTPDTGTTPTPAE